VQADVVAADDAPLGSGDPTRRWALRCDDGITRWPGITRNEAAGMAAALASRSNADGLVAVIDLGVVLSDGAGPYLVDADGVLVLVVDRHPMLAGSAIAMANLTTDRMRIGLVREAGAPAWEWVVTAELAAADRVSALDALVGIGDPSGLHIWNRVWDRRRGTSAIA
jgi:hypothetical protein